MDYGTKFVLLIVFILASNTAFAARKEVTNPGDLSLYANSLFRQNQALLEVPIVNTLQLQHNTAAKCLLHCMKAKGCQSYNYGAEEGLCVLLADSLCANETLALTPKPGFNYFDLTANPKPETKFLNDNYCQSTGRCAAKCFPRPPLVHDAAMTKKEAQRFCESNKRSLPMPRNFDENKFYIKSIKKLLTDSPEMRTSKNMKFWVGISDEEYEGLFMYDDGSMLSETFSAWEIGQPDGGKSENCLVMGESGEWRWFDVNCEEKQKFVCA